MRERKYKAWDKENNKMHSPDSFWISADGHAAVFGDDGNIYYTHWELIEYIGRKDKNGKEIFEGGIVKYTREKIKIETVNYSEAICAFLFGKDEIGDNLEDIEVIGNIYENPELLDE